MRNRFPSLLLFVLSSVATIAATWIPGTADPTVANGFIVNTASRGEVLSFYNCAYTVSEGYAANLSWTGNTTTGVAGTTSTTFKTDVLRRINFYRALVGLPADIFFNSTKSSKDQEAALMFSANANLSHTPPNTWTYYTANASEAAGNSNIALGIYGPGAIDGYMRDDGANNTLAGHRRWLTYLRANEMGTGDVPAQNSFSAANAIWVIGNFKASATPSFVTWPNSGYCPGPLVPARWSLSYPSANFAAATVTMTRDGAAVATTIISSTDNGYGDNTLVWEPAGLPSGYTSDVVYNVTVAGISGTGVPTSYTYTVTAFSPDVLGATPTLTGPANPSTSGATYTFNAIDQADRYEFEVRQSDATAWSEGLEDASASLVQTTTTGSYTPRDTVLVRTGTKALHLAFPDFNNQSAVLLRNIVPSATSTLQFYELGRFASTTCTLSAEVSTDDGATWTSLWSRPGAGLSSALWDASWLPHTLDLSAYAGIVTRLRFIARFNGGSITTGTSVNYGFFVDDIGVSNATQLVSPVTTALSSGATFAVLDATSAGATLQNNATYYLRVRPNVGNRWFGFGPLKVVTVQNPAAYTAWIAANYPTATGGPTADKDGDSIPNGVEYAFALNPVQATSQGLLPQPVVNAGNLVLAYAAPSSVTGVTYGAQSSENLVNWTNVPDTGTGLNHVFSISMTGKQRLFIRHFITIAP
jgi:hypothetical protein